MNKAEIKERMGVEVAPPPDVPGMPPFAKPVAHRYFRAVEPAGDDFPIRVSEHATADAFTYTFEGVGYIASLGDFDPAFATEIKE